MLINIFESWQPILLLKAFNKSQFSKTNQNLTELVTSLCLVLILCVAQTDSSAGGIQNKEGEKAITGLLDRSEEHTLVYEDNEGDKMFVGDVPLHTIIIIINTSNVHLYTYTPKLCLQKTQLTSKNVLVEAAWEIAIMATAQGPKFKRVIKIIYIKK